MAALNCVTVGQRPRGLRYCFYSDAVLPDRRGDQFIDGSSRRPSTLVAKAAQPAVSDGNLFSIRAITGDKEDCAIVLHRDYFENVSSSLEAVKLLGHYACPEKYNF